LEKLNEILLSIAGASVAFFGWVVRRLFKSVDKAHARITTLEKNIVDRPFLESQLAPIRTDLNLILSHLLEHRKTEKEKTRLKD
jgi:hypothetical protein